MTAIRMLWVSITVFVLATCGLAGMFFLSFRYFTYQGSGMDWIYEVGGLVVVLWCLTVFGVIASAVAVIISRKTSQRLTGLQK